MSFVPGNVLVGALHAAVWRIGSGVAHGCNRLFRDDIKCLLQLLVFAFIPKV